MKRPEHEAWSGHMCGHRLMETPQQRRHALGIRAHIICRKSSRGQKSRDHHPWRGMLYLRPEARLVRRPRGHDLRSLAGRDGRVILAETHDMTAEPIADKIAFIGNPALQRSISIRPAQQPRSAILSSTPAAPAPPVSDETGSLIFLRVSTLGKFKHDPTRVNPIVGLNVPL